MDVLKGTGGRRAESPFGWFDPILLSEGRQTKQLVTRSPPLGRRSQYEENQGYALLGYIPEAKMRALIISPRAKTPTC